MNAILINPTGKSAKDARIYAWYDSGDAWLLGDYDGAEMTECAALFATKIAATSIELECSDDFVVVCKTGSRVLAIAGNCITGAALQNAISHDASFDEVARMFDM